MQNSPTEPNYSRPNDLHHRSDEMQTNEFNMPKKASDDACRHHSSCAQSDPAIHIRVPQTAQTALRVLEDAGWEGWIVGGFVRDALLKKPDHDIDITTNATWKQTKTAFETQGFRTFETGTKHGTLTVEVGSDVFEVTTYRTEGAYTDGRHPDSVTFVEDIRKDLARRDFTINAMAYHPHRGLLDPFGGRQDLKRKLIRAVGDPKQRFQEDALRILRAVRFASQLNFSIDETTRAGMNAEKANLKRISVERIEHEIEGFLCGAGAEHALMENIDVLGEVVPELLPMKGFDQRTKYHIYDVLEHTAHVVSGVKPTPVLRWSALLHDIGKPASFTLKNGTGHFYGHPAISAKMAGNILRRLKVRPAYTHEICLLVRYHDTKIPVQPKAVKRMVQRLDERPDLFFDLCNLKKADSAAHAPGYTGGVQTAENLEKCMQTILDNHEPFRIKDMPISGKDVMNMGVPQGPAVGKILHDALDALIDGNIENTRADLLRFVRDDAKNYSS